jgi:GAF domain-containing protein
MDPTVASPPVWLCQLQQLLLVGGDLEDVLERVTVLGAATMRADSSCVIAVEPPARPLIVVGSDESALAVGKTDWIHREGPHLAVLTTRRSAYSPDLALEGRWSAFAIEARARNICCALSVPIQGPAGVMGVLSLYATRAHAYDEEVRRQVQAMADNIACVITISLRLAEQIQLNEDLRLALASRSFIDQAIGVIMAENRCDRETAFDILRRASQNRNVKLREVAANLVRSITGHEPVPGPFCPRQ